MTDKRRPFMKWYARDWRGDGALRMCSFAARGLWADLLSLMHDEGEPYGHLTINGRQPTSNQLARMLGGSPKDIDALLEELEAAGVFSRTDEGTIYSRRMVRDNERAEEGRHFRAQRPDDTPPSSPPSRVPRRVPSSPPASPPSTGASSGASRPPSTPESRVQSPEKNLKIQIPDLRAARASQTSTPEGREARWRQKVTEFAKVTLGVTEFTAWLTAVAEGDHEALERMNDAMRLAETNRELVDEHPAFLARGAA